MSQIYRALVKSILQNIFRSVLKLNVNIWLLRQWSADCDQITVTGDESTVECCIKTHCCNLLIFIVVNCRLQELGRKVSKNLKLFFGRPCHYSVSNCESHFPPTSSLLSVLVFWIRIPIDFGWVDSDPGGQIRPTKIEKSLEISCFEVLDVLFWGVKAFLLQIGRPYEGPGITKLQFFINKIQKFSLQ
jgi:hypothetical protein